MKNHNWCWVWGVRTVNKLICHHQSYLPIACTLGYLQLQPMLLLIEALLRFSTILGTFDSYFLHRVFGFIYFGTLFDFMIVMWYLQGMSFRICCSFGQISKICIWNSTLSWYEVRNDVWNWWLGQTQVTFSPFFALWATIGLSLEAILYLEASFLPSHFAFVVCFLYQHCNSGVKPNHMKPCVQNTWDWLCESFFAVLPCPWPICWVVD